MLCTWEQLTELVWPWLMSLRPEFVDVDVDRSRTTVVNVPAELRVVLEAHLTAHRLVLAGPVPHGGLRPWVIMPVDAPRGALWPQPFTNANLRTTSAPETAISQPSVED